MTVQEKEENKNSKKIINLIGVIFIGALGSALWEILLKQFFYSLGNGFVSIASFFNLNYIDHLYSDVGKGSKIEMVTPLALILFIIFLPAFSIIRLSRFYRPENSGNSYFNKKWFSFLFRSRKRAYIVILIATIPISVTYIDLLIKEASLLKAYNYIDRSLEIERPYVSEANFIILRSKFLQINNKEKLTDVLRSIDSIAHANKLLLEECNLYGINYK